MATQTPQKDNTHGEEDVEPRFTSEHNPVGYDDDFSKIIGSNYSPDEQSDLSDAARGGDPNFGGKVGRGELENRESNAASGAIGSVGGDEQSLLERGGASGAAVGGAGAAGGLFRTESPGRFASLRGNLSKFTRKRMATIAIVGILGGGGVYGGSILSGPFQFIHFAQGLQRHFRSNDDTSNDRTSKVLLYALAGKGAHRGRLGVMGNFAADKWEKRLLKESGLKPVYEFKTKRFVGFEIVDQNKAEKFLGDVGEGKNRRVQDSMGKGAEIRSTEGRNIVGSDNNPVDGKRRFVDLRDVNFADRRAWIKSIGRVTQTNKVASAIGSRLLIKRAGVNFHPLNKVKRKFEEANTRRKEIRDKRKQDIEVGDTKTAESPNAKETKDDKGNDTTPQADKDASEDTKKFIDDFKHSGVLKTAKSAAIITGVLCAAKGMGEHIDDFRFANNVMPMMRMGMNAVTTGNQAMSNDDLDIGTLGILSEFLYDKEKKTSVFQAESIRAENGKEGGIRIPKEADLGKLGEKPEFFQLLDDIPFLGTACDVQNFIGGLPVISQIGDVTNAVVDKGLGLVGISVDDAIQTALKAVAGKAVNPLAKGADYGSMANTGAFAAAGDQALAMGGIGLDSDQAAQLNELEDSYDHQDRMQKSVASRYFDPYDSKSVVGSIIDSSPSSTTQAADMLSNPIHIIGSTFSSVFSTFTPKAKAANKIPYDYGIPKYGFSVDELADSKFEDPYENAEIVEPQLPQLNDKYGKCFGITVDESGLHNADKSVNVFALESGSDDGGLKVCKEDKHKEIFQRYRFYIADTVNATASACNEADDKDPSDTVGSEACKELGVTQSQSSDDAGSDDPSFDGDAKQLACQIADNSKAVFNYVDTKGNSAKDVLKSICDTGKAFTDSDDAYAVQHREVDVNPKMLQAISEYLQDHQLYINCITNCDHSDTSNHYKGIAVDFDCNSNLDVEAWNKIAGKYGGQNNGETCSTDPPHWHYDFPK